MADKSREKANGVDISKLKAQSESYAGEAAKIAKRFEDANLHLKAMQKALDNSAVNAAMKAAQGVSAQLDPLREQAAKMAKIAAPAQEMAERLKATGIHDRLGDISARAAEGSRLANAIRGIEKQQSLLDDLSASTLEPTIPSIADMPIIENPIVETNRKLDRIEKQFSQISVIAKDSAQVATDLQAYAAEFLQKFEKAADDANQSGSKAIKVGWLALAIAVVIGAGQIFAPTLIRDQEGEALRQTVVDLNAEISTLRAEQRAANDRMIEALVNSDRMVAIAISEALAATTAQTVEVSD